MAMTFGSKKFKGYTIHYANDTNYRGTSFVNVFKIEKNEKNIFGIGVPFSREHIDGWDKEGAIKNAKLFILKHMRSY